MIQYIEGTNLAYCDGLKFRKDRKTGYWLCSTIRKRLHKYIWEKYNGPVPKGMHVHHIDHDKDNNGLNNLALVDPGKHAEIHESERTEEWRRARSERLYANLHLLAAGNKRIPKERRVEMYLHNKDKMHVLCEYTCDHCGKRFESTQTRTRFCSGACAAAHRRSSGADNETRICAICGKEFQANKYSKTRMCSLECGYVSHRLINQRKRGA